MDGCMDQWVGQWVGSGQMTNVIKFELIDIIWFLWRYLWVDEWVNGWPHVKSLKSNESWPIWDNSIMEIFLDILLKPPQPFIGLFFLILFPMSHFFSFLCLLNSLCCLYICLKTSSNHDNVPQWSRILLGVLQNGVFPPQLKWKRQL